jgi:uncharacterized protein GlcG (DUF336 family)
MTQITLDLANRLIEEIFAEGARLGLNPLSAVVTDAGASSGRFHIALGKASGALFLGVNSRKVGEMAVERPPFLGSLTPLVPGGIVPAAGGVLIEAVDGTLLGAVGVTGDTSDNDEQVALTGLAAADLCPRQ